MTDVSVPRLQAALAAEVAWRKKEISALRASAKRKSAVQDFVCRAGAVVLCAHWEGYLKSAIQEYIDYVFSLNMPLRDLSPNLVAVSIYKDVKTAALADYPGSEQHCIKLSKRVLLGIDVRAPKPKWKVETGGNPSSDVTFRLLRTAGLDEQLGYSEAEWAATKKFIDEQLLKDRHQIAHGEGLPIEPDVFVDRADRILGMLDALTDIVLEAAVNRTYLSALVNSDATVN